MRMSSVLQNDIVIVSLRVLRTVWRPGCRWGLQKEDSRCGLTATRLGGAGVESFFLKDVATWLVSVPATKSILSTVLVPATPTQAVLPSNVRPPLRAS